MISTTQQAMNKSNFTIASQANPVWFKDLIDGAGLLQPNYAVIDDVETLIRLADVLQYPLMLKQIQTQENKSNKVFMHRHSLVNDLSGNNDISHENPFLLEQFIEDAALIKVFGCHNKKNNYVIPDGFRQDVSVDMKNKMQETIDLLVQEAGFSGPYCAKFLVKKDNIYTISFRRAD